MTTRVKLQEAFKLALSITLFYWFALSMDWAMPKYGVLAIALVSTTTVGESLLKGFMRIVGTLAGAAVGLGLLFFFAQDPVGLVLTVAVLLVAAIYFMQTSRYPGAWLMMVIVGMIVWATGYGNADKAFHFAVFRTLETAAGVLAYMLVSVLLWPVSAEDRMLATGRELWERLAELGRQIREPLRIGEGAAENPVAQHQVASSVSQFVGALPAVYADTWSAVSKREILECLRGSLRALLESLDHLRLLQSDVRALEPERRLPGLEAALDTLQARLDRYGEIWERGPDVEREEVDTRLLKPLSVHTSDEPTLSTSDRTILALFVEALGAVDRDSREVLRCLRALVGLDSIREFTCDLIPSPLRQPSRWSLDRLQASLLPSACWLAACAFWFTVDPPLGHLLPVLAVAMGILLALHPTNLFDHLLMPLLLSAWIFVTPVYLFVLPHLDSAAALLVFVFVFCFIFGWAGANKPILKVAALLMFAMIADLTNHQTYSLMKPVLIAIYLIMGVGLPMLVYLLLNPRRPERALERELSRFFRACARFTEGVRARGGADGDRGSRLRRSSFESRILDAPGRMTALAKQLSATEFPEATTGALQQLVDGAAVLSLRLEALEHTHGQVIAESSELGASLQATWDSLIGKLRGVFERWSADGGDEQSELVAISEELERRIATLHVAGDGGEFGEEELRNLYVLSGSMRGLLDTMKSVDRALVPVNGGSP